MTPGLQPEGLEFYYPIAPSRALLLGRLDEKTRPPLRHVEADEVDHYNRMMAVAAHEQVFAASRDLLERVAKHRTETTE